LLLLPGCDPQPTAGAGAGPAGEAVVAALDPVADEDGLGTVASLPAEVTFNKDIQPILSEYCYHCHGPDSATRLPKEEPLRLDRAEDAFAPRKGTGKPVIVKGDAQASRLMELIRHADPEVRMPPPEGHKVMQPREIALVERWIQQGAGYEPHWSLVPVKRPAVPAEGAAWAANPIDQFIFAKMAAAGLKPNPSEEPRRFHRRLTFDLTGLPPRPEETAAFVLGYAKDPVAALDAEAERLLATTASAEHFARHWLDAARYADTHGIHIDNYRAIWPYRDWVIRAFQSNMPWDQFTIEQIAGDMLPNRTLDQQVASGFNRCMPTTSEGGAIAEEYEAIYALDQVSTTSAVWLGLTTGCAACHDHKFDPISTKEFYALTAFFRNTTMSAMDGNIAEHKPLVEVPLLEDRDRWLALGEDVKAVEAQLAARRKEARADFDKWLATTPTVAARSTDPALALHLPLGEDSGPLRGSVAGQPREWPGDAPRVAGPAGKALLVSGEPIDLGDLGAFQRGDQVSYGGFIRIEGTPTGSVVARMDPAASFRGWDLWLQDGRPGTHVIDTWDQAASKVVAKAPLEPEKWQHVMVVFDGKQPPNKTITIYVDGVRQEAEGAPNKVGMSIEAGVPLRLGARSGGESRLNGPVALQDFRFYRRLLSAAEVQGLARASVLEKLLATPAEKRTEGEREALFGYYIDAVDRPAADLRTRLAALKHEDVEIRKRGSVSLVMEEKKNSEPFAHVLIRGSYASKGERVTADTPAALPPMPADAPKNRLELARWLTDPANPLPARVTMNRTWYYIFGNGIVESTGDFGVTGARPSHPELLDWLAAEFVARKWNHREMLKLMVTSATYRQAATLTPEKLEADPANTLLARGPRLRLDAEQLRDFALASSGLLAARVGGPSVKPYQPEGIWEAVAMSQSNTKNYSQDNGEALYRRSLYTFWKRTAAPPTMEILNAPSREVTCVRRDRTNTPLQALVLLNDPQFVEAFRGIAAAALAGAKDFDARLDFLSMRLLARNFAPEERAIVKETFARALATYQQQPDAASKLIAVGASPVPPGFDPAELATWTLISSQIFNLDETLTR
jgi:hypothetical protein